MSWASLAPTPLQEWAHDQHKHQVLTALALAATRQALFFFCRSLIWEDKPQSSQSTITGSFFHKHFDFAHHRPQACLTHISSTGFSGQRARPCQPSRAINYLFVPCHFQQAKLSETFLLMHALPVTASVYTIFFNSALDQSSHVSKTWTYIVPNRSYIKHVLSSICFASKRRSLVSCPHCEDFVCLETNTLS